jgi:hypothetical protein
MTMNEVFQAVRNRRAQLQKTDFIQLLADTKSDPQARLAYVPDMLFFIMGFKDILHGLKVENSLDPIQLEVNEHCDEDNGHWKWFLKDLEVIEVKNSYLKKSNYKLFSELWSDESFVIRDLVYETIHFSKMAPTSAHRMVILEVIEAVFSVYVENMTVLVNQLGKYEDWKFFGRVHYDAENGHSNGSWLDGGKKAIKVEAHMSATDKELALTMIHRMYDRFEAMFAYWHKRQVHYLNAEKIAA